MEEDKQKYFQEQKRVYHAEVKSIRRAFRQDIYVKNRKFPSSSPTDRLESNKEKSQKSSQTEKETNGKQYQIYDKMREQQIREILEVPIQNLSLQNVFKELQSEDILSLHFGIISLRKLLIAFEGEKIIQAIIDWGGIPKIFSLSKLDSYSQIKYQSTWILQNISGFNNSTCQKLVYYKVHSQFIKNLNKNEEYLIDNLIVTLGNMASAGSWIRNALVEQGVIYQLIDLASNHNHTNTLFYVTWAISNILRCKPYLEYKEAIPALKYMCEALACNYFDSQPSQAYAIIASFLAFCNSQAYQLYYSQNLFNVLVEFASKYMCKSDFNQAIYGTGCLFARISNHSKYVKKMIGPSLYSMCENVYRNIVDARILKEYLFFISNLLTQEKTVTDHLVDNEQFFSFIAKMLRSSQQSLKIQILHILGNASHFSSSQIVQKYIQSFDILQGIAECLFNTEDLQFLVCILENLNKIVLMAIKSKSDQQNTQKNHLIFKFLAIPNIATRLSELQFNENKKIKQKISFLIEILKKDGWSQQEVTNQEI